MHLRHTVFDLLEADDPESRWAPHVRGFLVAAIAVNVAAVLFGTTAAAEPWTVELRWVQRVSVAIFSTEYIARIWSVGERVERPVVGRIRAACAPMMIIDLAAILPAFLPVFIDLRFLRSLRVVRLLKLTRHSEALQVISAVLYRKRQALLSSAFLAFILLIVSSSLMYYVEHPAQPDEFSSIPATMWWGVAALTSVGYGDIIPITPLGRILAAFVAFSGIGIFGLPAGILASAFSEELEERGEGG